MEKTRSAVKCPLFGEIGELKANLFPTYEDVMKQWEWTRCELKSKMEKPKEPLFTDIAEIVSSLVENIWQKASLPTVSHTRVIQMLKAYHLKCKNLMKSLKRLTEEKWQMFLTESRVLFDISSCKCRNIEQCICPKERRIPRAERAFLVDQRTSRKMIIGRIDVTFTKVLLKRSERSQTLNKRQRSTDIETMPAKKIRLTLPERDTTRDSIVPSFPLETDGKTKKIIPSTLTFTTLAKTCDRYGVSDRAAAAIASSVLHDIQSDVPIIDRHKLRRERQKTRENIADNKNDSNLTALYFDGRKDKTLKITKKGGRNYRTTTVEEHVSLVKEPGSIYLGYVVPLSGTAKSIVAAITGYLTEENISLDHLLAVGCDGTNVNTGKYAGAIRLLEKQLGRPLQWIVCLLHMNELPLRHLFLNLDGTTSGPNSYTGKIGKSLESCEEMSVVLFDPIQGTLPDPAADLSADQLYLHRIVLAVGKGHCPEDLAHKSPGKLSHARWLTRANRILRLYVATKAPSQDLTTLATFVVKVYAPVWFAIKNAPSCKHAARHFYEEISRSRYLPENLKKIVDPVIKRNSYAVHPENLLLSMLTDQQKDVRQLAVQRILKARGTPSATQPRLFEVPKLNLNASSYIDLIDWNSSQITTPPILQNLSDEEIKVFVESGGDSSDKTDYLDLPNHTQAVERSVKITTEAAATLCTKKAREGLIQTKLSSRKIMPKFDSKRDFKAE